MCIMPKPLISENAYPSTKGLSHDALSVRIISPAYSTQVGELNAILQYFYHSLHFDKCGYSNYAEKLMSIAIAEMMHFEILGKTILALGAAPVFTQYPPCCFNFYSTKYVAYSRTLVDMLEDDIIGEKQAIAGYERMAARLKNERVREIVERITEDERLHLSALEKMLKEFKC